MPGHGAMSVKLGPIHWRLRSNQKGTGVMSLPTRSRGTKSVALTYDDGPSDKSGELVRLLLEEGATATFFVTAENCTQRPEALALISAVPGLEIANHSYTHPNLTHLDEPMLEREVAGSKRAIEQTISRRVALFRPPEGQHDVRVRRAVADSGQAIIMWSLTSMDWKKERRPYVASTVVRQCRSGDIVLLHDWGTSDLEASRAIIRRLKRRGYSFVTVTELLGDVVPGEVYRGRVAPWWVFVRRAQGRFVYWRRLIAARARRERGKHD